MPVVRAVALVLCLATAVPLAAAAQGIEAPLADAGDPARGRAIVADRTRGLCILCHAAPLLEVPFMGDIGPDLGGVGSRLTVPELRERIVDSRLVNPDTIMPPYHSQDNLNRVGTRWQGGTILTEQEVEDVVAWLATLTEDGDGR